MHPICALAPNSGWTRRIIRTEDSGSQWDMFCPTHAAAVKDPVKPKPKKAPLNEPTAEEAAAVNRSRHLKARNSDVSLRMSIMRPPPEYICHAMAVISLQQATEMRAVPETAAHRRRDDSVFTLSEWPGMAEGEAMDLEHFWNFVSMIFPEDHTVKWVENTFDGILSAVKVDESLSSLHSIGSSAQRPAEEMKELSLTEKERSAALEYEKRSELLWSLCKSLKVLRRALDIPPDNGLLFPLLDYKEFLVECRGELAACTSFYPLKDVLLRVAFESESRKEACYLVSTKPTDQATPLIDENIVASAASSLIGFDPDGQNLCEKEFPCVSLNLDQVHEIAAEDKIYMHDKILIANHMNDFLNLIIKTDQHWHLKALEIVKDSMKSCIKKCIASNSFENETRKAAWKKIEERYKCQRIWKRVGLSTSLGMREQNSASFMKTHSETTPLQLPFESVAPQDVEIPIDDSICHVCFDGSSTETNSILFCDGCNTAMHQFCYGISEVPEGNYFCDRCRAIQSVSDDPEVLFEADEHGRDAVTCCLCPLYHGAIKPTTDGRWVHLCCALWSKDAIIENLDEMGPVNLSAVSAEPMIFDKRIVPDEQAVNVGSALCSHSQTCVICGVRGGLLTACYSVDEQCDMLFHPLCAWFEGYFISSTIIDPTFQGIDRDGIYPSGLSYSFCCFRHTPHDFAAAPLRKSQQMYRRKFRLDERDLICVPGQRKSKKKQRQVLALRKNNAVVPRDLNPDVYDAFVCAACISPIPDSLPQYLRDISSPNIPVLKCAECGIFLHKECYSKDPFFIADLSWRCNTCTAGVQDARCILCPRRGGYLVRAAEGDWVHDFCSRNLPIPRRKGVIEMRLIPKEYRKVKCVFCNRRAGVCLRCNELGCSVYFHALCAERSGKFYIRSSIGPTQSFCSEHIPAGVCKTSEGYWVDIMDVQALHYSLDRARLIMDTLRRRDRHKKMIYRTDGELMQLQLSKFIDRIMERRTLETPEKNIMYIEDEYDELDGELEDKWISRNFKSTVTEDIIQQGSTIIISTDIGELKISSTWIDENELKVPRRLKVVIAGTTISRKNTININGKDFKLGLLPRLMMRLESSYAFNSIVKKASDLVQLERQFVREWMDFKQMDLDQFIVAMAKKDIIVEKPHRKQQSSKKKRSSNQEKTHEELLKTVSHAGNHDQNYTQNHSKTKHTQLSKESYSENPKEPPAGNNGRKAHRAKKPKVNLWSFIAERMDAQPSDFERKMVFPCKELEDWRVVLDEERTALECRIQFIINRVMNFKIPVEYFTESKARRISKKRKVSNEERLIAEDFEEIPYDLIPNYNNLVRRPISLAIMLSCLQQHKYQNMASFCADFYEMLSNSRFITEEGSSVNQLV